MSGTVEMRNVAEALLQQLQDKQIIEPGSIPQSLSRSLPEDLQGYGGMRMGHDGKPTLDAPSLSPTAMMIALSSLNSKMTEESIKFGSVLSKGQEKDIEDQSEKRLKQIEEHFKNIAKAAKGAKCGFFGFFAKLFESLFTLNFKEFGDLVVNSLGNILKDLGQLLVAALSIAVAVALTGVTAGAGGPILGLVIAGTVLMVASMALGDPVTMDAIIKATPEDAQKGVGIAMSVIVMALGIASAVCTCVGSGGAGLKNLASKGMQLATSITKITTQVIDAGVTVNDGVKNFQSAQHQSDAMKNLAEADRISAGIEQIKNEQQRTNQDLKALVDAQGNIVQGVRDLIQTYGQAQLNAARA